jgi:hypothetical protein
MILKARDERLLTDQRIREVTFEADEHGVWAWAECGGIAKPEGLQDFLEDIVAEQTAFSHFRGATIQDQDRFGKVSLRLEERDRELADPLPMSPWYGVPGVSADLYLGTRTMLAFDRADPSNPFAALFSPLGQTGHVPKTVRHEANEEIRFVKESTGIVRVGNGAVRPVALAPPVDSTKSALTTFATALSTATTVPQVAAAGLALKTALALIPSSAATKLEAV